MKAIIILTAVLLIGNNCIAQDWFFVDSTIDGNRWYIKSSYVSKTSYGSDISIKIWTKQELKKTTLKKNGKTLTYNNAKELQLWYIDCTNKRFKIISTVLYNSKGDIVDNYAFEDYQQLWNDVVPESIGEAVLNKTCRIFN